MAAAEEHPEIPIVAPPRPRRQAGDVPHGDRPRLHERDDGRLAARRRQDALRLRVQRRASRARSSRPRTRRASPSRASSARSAASRTATARARCTSPIPTRPVDFVEQTGVDALAVAIGTSHGAYKFTAKPDGDVLAMHLIEEIHQKLPETHMVMHGSSSRPAGARRPDQRRGRQARGDLRRAGRGDPAGHPPRRAQGQRRHRRPPRDHRRRCAKRSTRTRPSSTRARSSSRRARRRSRCRRADARSSAPPATRGDYTVLSLDEMASATRSPPESRVAPRARRG